jgi:hypothetical protein
VVRYFFEMRRDLAQPIDGPVLPEGFRLTHSRGAEDAAAWSRGRGRLGGDVQPVIYRPLEPPSRHHREPGPLDREP